MESPSLACIAPPLTDELLKKYKLLINDLEERSLLRDCLESLMRCAEAWWDVRESVSPARRVSCSTGITKGPDVMFQPLDSELVHSLWDSIPWMHDITEMEKIFDALPSGDLRNAAFHLSWYAKELFLDREPISTDRIVR